MIRGQQNGFTLIEQVIVMSVIGILLPVLAGFYFQAFLAPVQNSAQLAVISDIKNASAWFTRDLAAGPMGNNLTLPGSGPALTSVTIGSSPGFSGNNSLTIVYRTWPLPTSTTTETHSITYRLEDMDPTDDDIQLVRREDDWSVVIIVKHIANPSHVIFSGSAESAPGGVSPGLTIQLTSTLEGSTSTAKRTEILSYGLNRTYQPTPLPPPTSKTWNIAVPYMFPGKIGFFQVIETKGSGNISANWQLAIPADIKIAIYRGEPMMKPLGDTDVRPDRVPGMVITSSGTTDNINVITESAQEAGKYTIYYFNDSTTYVNTTNASVTYVSQ